MRLTHKLILFVLAAAVLPLSVAGLWLLKQSEAELGVRLEREQRAIALAAAEGASAQLVAAMGSVAQSAGLIDWLSATPEEVAGGLRLLVGQSNLVLAAVLVDPRRQAQLPGPQVAGAEFDTLFDTDTLGQALPLDTLSTWGDKGLTAVGPAQGEATPWLPVAIQVGPRGPASQMIVVALNVGQLNGWLLERAPPDGQLELVDGEGRVVAGSIPGPRLRRQKESRAKVAAAAPSLARTVDREQVASAGLPGKLGLVVTVSVPLEVAREPVARLRRTVLGGMAATALVLGVTALLFVRGLTRRLDGLASVAGSFARGDLKARVAVAGRDEVAHLSNVFNSMGAELEVARAKLLRWNDELRQRVDEALADLRAAQAQLLEAQKLAAVGQLGAGVAHEINNPLCGILGNAQLLLLDRPAGDPDFEVIKKIEDSAKRCRDITQNLLRFSQSKGEVTLSQVDLNEVVAGALAFELPRHREAQVEVVERLQPGPLPVDGDPEALQQVMAQIFSNARTAMRASKVRTLTVSTRREEAEVLLIISDTGKGISSEDLPRVFEPFFTTKDIWSNIGLGLSVAYRIMEEHQGRIDVESPGLGGGATFTVRLKPAGAVVVAPRRAKSGEVVVGGTGIGIRG